MNHPRVSLVPALLALAGLLSAASCGADGRNGLVSVPCPSTGVGGAQVEPCYWVPTVPLGVVPPAGGFVPGCRHVVVLEGGDGTRGNYGLLQLPPCEIDACRDHGDLGCQLAQGYGCALQLSEALRTIAGAHTGVVRAAMETRFASDTDQREAICYADYHGNGLRVIVVPLTTALEKGRDAVTVTGFASFFLRDIPRDGGHDTLDAEFISNIVMGDGSLYR